MTMYLPAKHAMNSTVVAFLPLIILSACAAGLAPTSATTLAEPVVQSSEGQTCQQIVTQFDAILMSVPPPIGSSSDNAELPQYPLTAATPEFVRNELDAGDIVRVSIRVDGLSWSGESVSENEFEDNVSEIITWRHTAGLPTAFGVYASRDVSMQRVAEALESILELGVPVFLAARGPSPMEPQPCPAELEELCAASTSYEVAVALGAANGAAIQACVPLIRLYTRTAGAPAYQKDDMVRGGIARALLECNCEVDMPILRYTTLRILSMFEPRFVRLAYPGVSVSGASVAEWAAVQPNPNWSSYVFEEWRRAPFAE